MTNMLEQQCLSVIVIIRYISKNLGTKFWDQQLQRYIFYIK